MDDSPIRVLIVEDDEEDYLYARHLLALHRGRRFEIAWVQRLSAALEHVRGAQADVVLLDLGLPDSQGWDTFLAVRDQAPDLPLILLTGFQDDELGTRALKDGAQDYLVKGNLTTDLLCRTVLYAIERRHSRDALQAAYRELESLVGARTRELTQMRQRLESEVQRREHAERMLKEGRRLEALCAFVDHAARRFATALKGIGERAGKLLEAAGNGANHREHCEGILKDVTRAADISARLVSLDRVLGLELGEPQPVDAARLAREVLQECGAKLKAHCVVAVFESSPDLPSILVEPGQMFDILRQLVGGAPEVLRGAGKLRIVLSRAAPAASRRDSSSANGQKPQLLLEVFYGEEALDEPLLDGLLNPLVVPADRQKRVPAGFGLALVCGRLRGWGGDIEVFTEQGGGSSVRVYLPVASGVSAAPAAAEPEERAALVVDDDGGTRDAMKSQLAPAGWEARTAGSAAEAEEALKAGRFHAVFLDATLPGGQTESTWAAVRQLQPDASVVLMSGFSRDYVRSLLPSGSWIFLQKPFDQEALDRALQAASAPSGGVGGAE